MNSSDERVLAREDLRLAILVLRSKGFIVTAVNARERTLTVRLPDLKG